MAKIYLSNYELNDAINIYFKSIEKFKASTETISVFEATDRIASSAVYATISSPHFNASAMDGIATSSVKTFNANDKNHITLEQNKDYVVVDTGDPLPKQFDCVIMVEDLINIDNNRIKIYKSAVPGQNIRFIGEDIIEGQLILPSNHMIRPVDIGALLAGGINSIEVYKKPIIGIIPTGTELVEPGSVLKEGDLIEFNSRVFSAQVEQWGAVPKRYPIVKDDYDQIELAVEQACKECDIVIINAGSSAGREDYTSDVISKLGNVIVHGVAIKPGKPVILGTVDNKPVIGIPGYPVSAYFIMENIVKRVIEHYYNKEYSNLKKIEAILTTRINSSLKYHEFVRVKLGYVDNKVIATPLARGAGTTMSLVNADGILEVPINTEGIEEGSTVTISLLKDKEQIKNTIVCIGSHDPIIDIAQDMFQLNRVNCSISTAHIGSLGGIRALKKGEAHIAPIHLLDMNTGEYNVSYIKRYIKDTDISLIKFVKRIQGLMVPKGNPLNIKGLLDLTREDVRFINRQRGSGTRVLLDSNLKKLNINPANIKGYQREEFTHLSVAAAIQSNDADCGLGVYSAAKIMNLDFIPIFNEDYDLAVTTKNLGSENVSKLIHLITSEEFKQQLNKLGGYDYSETGKIINLTSFNEEGRARMGDVSDET